MGKGSSSVKKAQEAANLVIERQIKEDQIQMAKEVKLLLLGTGECGKSTIVKQMKIIHQHGYSNEEQAEFKSTIYTNIVQSIVQLIRAMSKLGIEFDEENRSNREQDIKRVMFFFENRQDKDSIDAELAANIKSLWEDPAIQQCFNRANEFQLNDSAHYYLDQVDRITGADYLPTEQDILRARVQTTGIVEIRFPNSEFMFRVFDVGGQRSERRKWIHCFENVTSIIFITAISEYDQVLLEDASTNRMHESLTLFDNIFNNRYFVKTSFILFLNKIDVFEEKIKHSLIKACFPEYDEPNEFEPGIKFIEHKFKSVNVTNVKEIYCHPTCATDTQNVQFVLAAVNDIIVQGNLATTGLY